jgi:hypothetical protein
VFDKLIQILVFGCGYRRIADATCSATPLRRRRDEWITLGRRPANQQTRPGHRRTHLASRTRVLLTKDCQTEWVQARQPRQ